MCGCFWHSLTIIALMHLVMDPYQCTAHALYLSHSGTVNITDWHTLSHCDHNSWNCMFTTTAFHHSFYCHAHIQIQHHICYRKFFQNYPTSASVNNQVLFPNYPKQFSIHTHCHTHFHTLLLALQHTIPRATIILYLEFVNSVLSHEALYHIPIPYFSISHFRVLFDKYTLHNYTLVQIGILHNE